MPSRPGAFRHLTVEPEGAPGPPGVRHGTRKERDVRRLTRRRHIDLGRVSSAFCCREV
ncbi:putative leader peptide [Streptomyces sp. NPDC007346]|uniref:putative leader peptide n=1 Tax=Streptomyces sp. NPDC007346 TaxID=3154682 RepID=UPI0034533AC7